jgi:hypothetical protein
MSNVTTTQGIIARKAPGAVAQSYEITNFRVQDSTVGKQLIITNASTSLTGLTLLNVTVNTTQCILGDFPVINGVTIRASRFLRTDLAGFNDRVSVVLCRRALPDKCTRQRDV